MGAQDFTADAKGKTAKEAFASAQDAARYEYGHGGYTGSIAEKSSFEMIPVPADYVGREAEYAQKLINDDDDRVSDKWGPAGCIKIKEDTFLFFGWASS